MSILSMMNCFHNVNVHCFIHLQCSLLTFWGKMSLTSLLLREHPLPYTYFLSQLCPLNFGTKQSIRECEKWKAKMPNTLRHELSNLRVLLSVSFLYIVFVFHRICEGLLQWIWQKIGSFDQESSVCFKHLSVAQFLEIGTCWRCED